MFEFVIAHQFWSAVVLYWIFSAAISAMPEPAANGNPGYIWLYRFLHTIAGNLTTAFAGKIPGLKTLAFILIVPFLLVTPACAMHSQLHPGALDKTDSAAYDTLESYNVTRSAWLAYRSAISIHAPADTYVADLSQNLTNLALAIRILLEAK